jgi:hypothetical protein
LRTAVSSPTIVPIYFLEVSGAGDNSDCPLPDLLSGFASFNSSDLPIFPICDPDPQVFCAVSFEEGSVFYNGNTSNSTAFYTVSAAYCINSTSERKCEAGQWINEVILEKVATEDFLQVWNIVLIVIGGVAFVLGDAVAAGLGVYLALRSTKTTDKVLAIGMIVASVLIVLPVAGPVALITYIVLKKLGHDSKKVEIKWWYRILMVFGICLKVIGILLWLVQAGYSATQDFYGEGPLRDDNGRCVPHQPNRHQMMVQDVLVILSHAVSIILAIDQQIKAFLTKKGTRSAEGTDSAPSKPKPVESRELSEYPSSP